jgi:serine/threonine-protein kinase HipA
MTESSALAVWSGAEKAGLLACEKGQRYVFGYERDASGESQVSLTMPVRLESWTSRNLHPVFQMNLPEGAQLELIRRALAKIAGDDDLTILRVTGGNQIGRNRFTLPDAENPGSPEPPESLEELLTYPDTEELFHELLTRYALRSGISGVQPKVMLEATERGTVASAGFIVKAWGTDYPQLAANEFFCMTAAKLAGLPTPDFHLSNNGRLFIMKRFDFAPDGTSLGFEDFCSLQGFGTSQKYSGSYERLARSLRDYVTGTHLMAARKQFFTTLVLSWLLRNGDAHLKNFGVLYRAPAGPVTLAPVYDLVSTTPYIRNDVPALTLEGSKKWWPKKVLERFALSHLTLSPGTIREVFENTAASVSATCETINSYCTDHPEFIETGERMAAAWQEGLAGLKGD